MNKKFLQRKKDYLFVFFMKSFNKERSFKRKSHEQQSKKMKEKKL